jgi:hypothetical protein
MIDLKPHPHELEGRARSSDMKWPKALAELIDNSFDAGATRVDIEFGKGRQLVVEDDGAGCSRIEDMLRFGGHHPTATTKVGRYGLGLKDCAVWLWGTTSIATTSKGRSLQFSVDWEKLKKQGHWKVADPIDNPANGRAGTRILFGAIVRSFPHDYDRLVDELSFLFTPGLLQGRQIVFRSARKTLTAKPYTWPPLVDVIEDEWSVRGKTVRLHAGIVKEGHANPKDGFTYCHHHRVILNSALGAGEHSVRRVCGQIYLGEKWKLSLHKDNLDDDRQVTELAKSIEAKCEAILAKADQQAELVASAAFNRDLNARFQQAVAATKRARRKPRENQTGGAKPTGEGAKHQRATNTQDGDGFPDVSKMGRMRIEWEESDPVGVGRVDGAGKRVCLNERHPRLAQLRSRENVEACLIVAIGLLSDYCIHHEASGQKLMAFKMPAEYSKCMSSILLGLSDDDKPTKRRKK